MNVIDFILVVIGLGYLATYWRLSLVYCISTTVGLFAGMLLVLFLAPSILQSLESNLRMGILFLILFFGMGILFYVLSTKIGNKLRMKALTSKFATLDRWLAVPYKIWAFVLLIIILAQTLIYVPVVSLQYLAQGSSFLYVIDKFMPDLVFATQARKLAPGQFSSMHPDYDPNPLTYNNVANAGSFQPVVDKYAPSVVKVSSRRCTGLGFGTGFIVAPNFAITNAHVIAGGNSIYVSDHEGTYPATPVAYDTNLDIAVIYSKFMTGRPLKFAETPALPGTENIILGYPGAGDLQLTQGQISEYNLPVETRIVELNTDNALLTSAAASPGSSGSPILNADGEVIAVANGIFSGSTIGIKADKAKAILDAAQKRWFPTKTNFCEVWGKSL